MNNNYEHINPKLLTKKKDGTGEVTVFFESDKLLFATFELAPGCSLNKDIHPNGDEGYYVLEGELTVNLVDINVTRQVKKGEVFYIKSGITHIASNSSEQITRVIAAIGPKCN